MCLYFTLVTPHCDALGAVPSAFMSLCCSCRFFIVSKDISSTRAKDQELKTTHPLGELHEICDCCRSAGVFPQTEGFTAWATVCSSAFLLTVKFFLIFRWNLLPFDHCSSSCHWTKSKILAPSSAIPWRCLYGLMRSPLILLQTKQPQLLQSLLIREMLQTPDEFCDCHWTSLVALSHSEEPSTWTQHSRCVFSYFSLL